MWEEVLRAIPVYLSSTVKFIFGPVGGYAAGLRLLTTILVTVAGMMTSVLLFTYAGDWIRKKIFHRFTRGGKRFSQRTRRFVSIWKKYGLAGVAAMTPILLTPIGGTILAVSSGSPKERIILFMFVSAAIWSVVISIAVYFFGSKVLPDYLQ